MWWVTHSIFDSVPRILKRKEWIPVISGWNILKGLNFTVEMRMIRIELVDKREKKSTRRARAVWVWVGFKGNRRNDLDCPVPAVRKNRRLKVQELEGKDISNPFAKTTRQQLKELHNNPEPVKNLRRRSATWQRAAALKQSCAARWLLAGMN